MNIINTAYQAALEISETVKQIDEESVCALIKKICNSKKIYVAGAGRSMLMLRAIAMRLMHVGFETYIVGDTTTPAFEKDDLIIIGSGSGETPGLINIAQKAKNIGGQIAVITTREDSTISKLSDIKIIIKAYTDKIEDTSQKKTILPGGTLFEETMLLLGDSIILPLAVKMGIPTDKPFKRHANLE